MKYTEKDLYKGMKLRCTDDGLYDFWKKGAIYTIEENPYGSLVIRGEGEGTNRPTYDVLNYLNGETLVKMEIVEEEKEMEYTEKDLYEGMRLLCNDEVNVSWWTRGKEYKVIKSVSKLDVDKLGPYYIYDNDGDKRDTYSTILNGLNDKKAPVTFEIVEEEKEVPTLKEAIQAKIDELTTEAEHLFTKRDRLEKHGINLNKKAQKLKEVLETIKEFE